MDLQSTTIVALYEDGDLNPELISQVQGLELSSVKLCLATHSNKYRASLNGSLQLVDSNAPGPAAPILAEATDHSHFISPSELKEFINYYKDIARYSDNDAVRERAIKNLLNLGLKITDGVGENDARKLIKEASNSKKVNIIQFNQFLKASREAKSAIVNNIEDDKKLVNV